MHGPVSKVLEGQTLPPLGSTPVEKTREESHSSDKLLHKINLRFGLSDAADDSRHGNYDDDKHSSSSGDTSDYDHIKVCNYNNAV